MRGNDVVGCPTGDAIRALVWEQRHNLCTETDSSSDVDFYGVIPNPDVGERTPGMVIVIGDAPLAARLLALDSIEVGTIEGVGLLLISDRDSHVVREMLQERTQLRIIHREVQVYCLSDSAAVDFDSPLYRTNVLFELRDWERRNQPPKRPPRHIRGGKHRLK
jgi:hypothetical protein